MNPALSQRSAATSAVCLVYMFIRNYYVIVRYAIQLSHTSLAALFDACRIICFAAAVDASDLVDLPNEVCCVLTADS